MDHLTQYVLSALDTEQKIDLYLALKADVEHLIPVKTVYHVFRMNKVGRLAYAAPGQKDHNDGWYLAALTALCDRMGMELVFIHDEIHERFHGDNDGVGFFLNDGTLHKVTDLDTLDPEIAELIPDPRGERQDGKASICFRRPEGGTVPRLYDAMKRLEFCSIYKNDGIIEKTTSKGTVVINEYAQSCD